MARHSRHGTLAERIHSLVGAPVVSSTPVAGGDICQAVRTRLNDGRCVFVKTRPGAPEAFFATEVHGLGWLDGSGGVATPEVLGYDRECLILEWIEPGRTSEDAAARLGRALAATHQRGADRFGADADGFVGTLPAPNSPCATWPEFYAARRIEPYLRTASRRGTLDPADATAISAVLDKIDQLAGPAEPPGRIHGDLWSGNIVWAADDVCRLVDPAAYGGHRETDLALLALFGTPHLDVLLAAYHEVYPLADGWRERAGLHQLHPLLVHAVLFGGRYGARAGNTARALLGRP